MHDYWLERWDTGNIGFHRSEAHGALARHWRPTGGEVLVPLCGKSLDLIWLAQRGCAVVGVELAERAVRDFFAEQQLAFRVEDGALPAYVCEQLPITIYQGDYFELDGVRCDALYDRASIVALPPEARDRYAAHTDALLREGAEKLVITFEYPQDRVPGPPYSVPADELLRRWPGLDLVEEREVLAQAPPKFRAAGLEQVLERVWRSA